MTPTDTVPAVVASPSRTVLLPRVLALAGPRDPAEPGGPSVVRVVPRERLVARRVYVAVDAAGWPVYAGSTSDELRRLHEHEARLGPLVGGGALTWVWFPADDAWACEEGLIRLLRPTALRTRTTRDGGPLGPTRGQVNAMRAAGLHL